jgi:hypothetical protein
MKIILTLNGCFPLTLTLSPEERGQRLDNPLKSRRDGAECCESLIETLGAFLLLPKEEGRGEGKCDLAFQIQTF